jgi:hypothetical protein
MYHLGAGKTDSNVANSPRMEATMGLLCGPVNNE